jgi:hypothetical protein
MRIELREAGWAESNPQLERAGCWGVNSAAINTQYNANGAEDQRRNPAEKR